ncbi:hypothetical protein [Fundicoccus culcitae]|uniref:Uncharacterized protein n=1 Tax=Fundicoccus culcitae TaxID=2969821 RepID=A0ABY5P984_9LACT|nr:hypothetical protein [Fundicoccus culcitae]UUX35155.1 hypothetical protein NRE15_05805 [Fundicoccus culcitae]
MRLAALDEYRKPPYLSLWTFRPTCRISSPIDVRQINLPDVLRNRRPALPNFPAISSTCRISFHIDVHQTNLPAVTLNRRPAFPLFLRISPTCRISFHNDVHQTNLPDVPRNRRPAFPLFLRISPLAGFHSATTSAKSTFGCPAKLTSGVSTFSSHPTHLPAFFLQRRPPSQLAGLPTKSTSGIT